MAVTEMEFAGHAVHRLASIVCIVGRIGDSQGRKRLAALRTLVACPAMPSLLRTDAGEGPLQWQATTALQHGGLVEMRIRKLDLDVAAHSDVDNALEVRKELGPGIGKRVAAENAQGQF